jgi:nucleotide-binding universal stress UspA family protein
MITAGKDTPETRGKLEAAAGVLRNAGYTVDAIIEDGEPEDVIARHAEADHIDLLIMGAYGHSRVRNLIIGSTTTEMIRSVLIPVMLFR